MLLKEIRLYRGHYPAQLADEIRACFLQALAKKSRKNLPAAEKKGQAAQSVALAQPLPEKVSKHLIVVSLSL